MEKMLRHYFNVSFIECTGHLSIRIHTKFIITNYHQDLLLISRPVELKYTKYSPDSPPTRPPVLFLHGLFGSKINFSNPARKLSKELALEVREPIPYSA